MDWTVRPSARIYGEITPPADKSITHRAIMLAALAEGESVIENYLPSEDCMNTLEAFRMMGIRAERTPRTLRIQGNGINGLKQPDAPLYAGNSGTTVRLLSGILAGQNILVQVTGDASLSRRPMNRVMEPLRRMGVKIIAREDNYLPLQIKGNPDLEPIFYNSPVASAQVKSCVLLAGIQAKGITRIQEPVKSRDHTERMLLAAGADIRSDATSVSVHGPAELRPQHMAVPGDISSAAFFLVAGAVLGSAKLVLKNVGVNPTRDGIIEVLRAMGASLALENEREVSGEPVADLVMENSRLKPLDIRREIVPRLVDEIPVLVLAATQAHGTSVISGAGELRVKESDRLKTISTELNKMGAKITEQKDGLVIEGPTPLKGAVTQSYGDHRVAMTLAVAALIADGETVIRDVDCVNTSFPGFHDELMRLVR